MQQTANDFIKLQADINSAFNIIGIEALNNKLTNLLNKQQQPDFWNDTILATSINKEITKLKLRTDPWINLQNEVNDNCELAKTLDVSLAEELAKQLDRLTKEYNNLKNDLLFNGKYDDYDAIISIYAGAGGTDAQDWAEMLLRMYLRYIEQDSNLNSEIIQQSSGDEAGLKSVSFEVNGPLAYGKLQSENGVHRLVRLSPFNADNLRQTSFARVEVVPKIAAPEEVAIEDQDLKIDVYRAGGHGGQSVNTTDSAVRITHIPTNITVAIQNERSQLQNKETALTILRSKLAQLQTEQHQDNLRDLKGPNEQAAWGNQIRSYVLHPYNMVKDLRTRYETSDTQGVLDGKIQDLIFAYLEWKSQKSD